MHNRLARFLLIALLFTAIATAGTINVTNSSQVTLQTNDSLLFYISASELAGHGAMYPGEIEIVLGTLPIGGLVGSIPGTSAVYMPGFLFDGTLESQSGSVSIPLTDSNAARLGLPAGDMLLTPGSRSGASYSGPIDLLSAAVTISSQEDAALFASGEVVIDLHNTGAAITFGYPGASLTSDFSASLVSPDGLESVGAQVMEAELVHTPEPGTVGLLLVGLLLMVGLINPHGKVGQAHLACAGLSVPLLALASKSRSAVAPSSLAKTCLRRRERSKGPALELGPILAGSVIRYSQPFRPHEQRAVRAGRRGL
jgi:hypothetical protein